MSSQEQPAENLHDEPQEPSLGQVQKGGEGNQAEASEANSQSAFLEEGGGPETSNGQPQQLSRNPELPPNVSEVLPSKSGDRLMDGMQLSSMKDSVSVTSPFHEAHARNSTMQTPLQMQKVPEEDKSTEEEMESPPLENIRQIAQRQQQMATTNTSLKSEKKRVQFSSLEEDKKSGGSIRPPSQFEIPEASIETKTVPNSGLAVNASESLESLENRPEIQIQGDKPSILKPNERGIRQKSTLDVTFDEGMSPGTRKLNFNYLKKPTINFEEITDYKSTESSKYKTEKEIQRQVQRKLERRLIQVRRTSTIMLRNSPLGNHHSKDDMVRYAMQALRAIKYDKKITGITMFEDIEDTFNGWNFIMRKIFQLPRNERFLRVLTLREEEAQRNRERALKRELGKQFKMKQKIAKVTGNVKTESSPEKSKASPQRRGTQFLTSPGKKASVQRVNNLFIAPPDHSNSGSEEPGTATSRKVQPRPSMISMTDMMRTPTGSGNNDLSQMKRKLEEQMKANQLKIRELSDKQLRFQEGKKQSDTFYSPIVRGGQVIPPFVLNSPSYKRIHKLSVEADKMSADFYKYCEYLIRVKKMIDETKREIEDEDDLVQEVLAKRDALSRSPQRNSPKKSSQLLRTAQKSPSSKASSILNIQFSIRKEDEDYQPLKGSQFIRGTGINEEMSSRNMQGTLNSQNPEVPKELTNDQDPETVSDSMAERSRLPLETVVNFNTQQSPKFQLTSPVKVFKYENPWDVKSRQVRERLEQIDSQLDRLEMLKTNPSVSNGFSLPEASHLQSQVFLEKYQTLPQISTLPDEAKQRGACPFILKSPSGETSANMSNVELAPVPEQQQINFTSPNAEASQSLLQGAGSVFDRSQKRIQKQLEEHLLIQDLYDHKPDYKKLARQILTKETKSKVGLENQHRYVLEQAKLRSQTRPKERDEGVLLKFKKNLDALSPHLSNTEVTFPQVATAKSSRLVKALDRSPENKGSDQMSKNVPLSMTQMKFHLMTKKRQSLPRSMNASKLHSPKRLSKLVLPKVKVKDRTKLKAYGSLMNSQFTGENIMLNDNSVCHDSTPGESFRVQQAFATDILGNRTENEMSWGNFHKKSGAL